MKLRTPRLATLCLLLLAASAIYAAAAEPGRAAPTSATQTQSPAVAQRIAPGDRLAVSFFIATADPDTTYTLEPGDELYLNFRWSPELSQVYVKKLLDDEEKRRQDKTLDKISVLSRAYIVQPDGTLVLTGIPEPLKVRGLTTRQVAGQVEAIYKKSGLLQHPELNVSVNPQYRRYEALRRTIQPDGGRAIITLPVPADGRIGLPLAAEVAAAGKSVKALGEELTARYRALGFPLVTVTVWYDAVGGPGQVRVLGEVKKEGLYQLGEDADLWDAVAQAGGFTPQADVNAVRVVGRDGKSSLGPFSFEQYLATGDAKANVKLKGDELIFVPGKK